MRVERQNAFPSGAFDVLGAADFFFPKGMDHHTMMTSPRALNAVLNKVVRQLGGLGKLPDDRRGRRWSCRAPRHEHVDVAGHRRRTGGARLRDRVRARRQEDAAHRRAGSRRRLVAGASAARRARGQRGAGGGAQGGRRGAVVVDGARPGIPRTRATTGGEPGLLAVHTPEGLLKLTAERYVYATGAYDQNAIFVDNDRPGVLPARAVGRLLVRFGVRAGGAAGGRRRRTLCARARRGAHARRRQGHAHRRQRRADRGRARPRAGCARVETTRRKKIKCDLVAVAALPAPARELPRQHGVPSPSPTSAAASPAASTTTAAPSRITCSPAATSPASCGIDARGVGGRALRPRRRRQLPATESRES